MATNGVAFRLCVCMYVCKLCEIDVPVVTGRQLPVSEGERSRDMRAGVWALTSLASQPQRRAKSRQCSPSAWGEKVLFGTEDVRKPIV